MKSKVTQEVLFSLRNDTSKQRCLSILLCLLSVACSVLSYGSPHDSTQSSQRINGAWLAYKMIAAGQELPMRDPRLILSFEFFEDGQNILHWTYDDDETFCERKGQYIYKDNFLLEEVTWVNPLNKDDCGQDPDMQLGKRAISRLEIKVNPQSLEDELHLYIPFGDEDIIYVWKKKFNKNDLKAQVGKI